MCPYKLTTEANMQLFFRKKSLPVRHDNMVSFDYAMVQNYILTKKTFNLGIVIQEVILNQMVVPKGAKPFPFHSGEVVTQILVGIYVLKLVVYNHILYNKVIIEKFNNIILNPIN